MKPIIVDTTPVHGSHAQIKKFSDLNLTACKAYAGIGSRETPADVMMLMTRVATKLEQSNIILRSGGADGADTAFANGVVYPTNKRIYLPWVGFNNAAGVYMGSMMEDAAQIAKQYHPRWSSLSRGAKALITRNTFQILGDDLKTPADFIICWTKDGKASGGTGQGLRIAKDYEIPIFNLQKENHFLQLTNFVEGATLNL